LEEEDLLKDQNKEIVSNNFELEEEDEV